MGSGRAGILVLVKGLGIGGAERLIADAARFWDRARFDYRVGYVLPWKDQLVPALEELELETVCFGGRRGFDLSTPKRIRRFIKTHDVTLVHAHLPSTGILARLVAGVPVVYTEHNLTTSYRMPTRLVNRVTYPMNAAVTAVSEAVRQTIDGYRGPPPVVVENGVSIQTTADDGRIRTELGLGPDDALVVHVGNIRPHKGHSNLIRAAELVAAVRSDVTFVSVGGEKHPGDLERLRATVAESELSNVIRFMGRRSDATDFIAAADVFVNPSDYEGLPVSILEAQALAKPVVATRVGGVPSVVVEDHSGHLVEPRDPRHLAKAILEVLDSPDRGREMGENGRKHVAENHDTEKMVRRFEAIYQDVIRTT